MANNERANNERKTRGRQKIAMVRMEKESNRLVTFSKRRAGLFKKASELCTLCGVDAAIIVFSPGRKAFSFGHPSVDATINRFMLDDSFYDPAIYQGQNPEPQANANILRSNARLTVVGDQIELEKRRGEELLGVRKPRKEDFEWLNPIEGFGLGSLKRLQGSLTPLKDSVLQLYREIAMEVHNGNGLPLMAQNTSGSAYQFPSEMVGDQNMATFYGGQQPYQMAMVPTTYVGGPSAYEHSQMMMEQTPTGGFGDSSLTMGQDDMVLNELLNAHTNANALSTVPDSMGFNYPTQNQLTSYQGQNNSIEGQFGGLPPLSSMNMGFNHVPVNYQSFASSSSGTNGMNAPTAPFNYQNGFAFDNNGFP